MNASIQAPPPLERYSAEKFRQWLAGMVSDKPPSNQTDRDQMRQSLTGFLSRLPMVYGLKDRMTMWEKIGNAAIGALETFGYLAAHDLPVHPAYAMLGGGRWERDRIRVASLGGRRGDGIGRAEWEREYYSDVLNRLAAGH